MWFVYLKCMLYTESGATYPNASFGDGVRFAVNAAKTQQVSTVPTNDLGLLGRRERLRNIVSSGSLMVCPAFSELTDEAREKAYNLTLLIIEAHLSQTPFPDYQHLPPA